MGTRRRLRVLTRRVYGARPASECLKDQAIDVNVVHQTGVFVIPSLPDRRAMWSPVR